MSPCSFSLTGLLNVFGYDKGKEIILKWRLKRLLQKHGYSPRAIEEITTIILAYRRIDE